MQANIIQAARLQALEFLKYVNVAPSPYHATREAMTRLSAAGFHEIREEDSWIGKIRGGGKYFVSRGGSSLVAFTCGKKFNKENSYFKVVGTHTDSPCIRLAPNSKLISEGYHMAYIQTYGGGLWHTWLDRDLNLAGRVVIKDSQGRLVHRLYASKAPVELDHPSDRENQ